MKVMTFSGIKEWVMLSPHGVVRRHNKYDGRSRAFLSMGVVKPCNEAITWDSAAMARGEPWERRGRLTWHIEGQVL